MAQIPEVPELISGANLNVQLKTYLIAVAVSTMETTVERQLETVQKWYDWIKEND